jgi:hypothetical protein
MGESLKVEKRKKKWKKMEKKMESPWNVRFHKSKERFFFLAVNIFTYLGGASL